MTLPATNEQECDDCGAPTTRYANARDRDGGPARQIRWCATCGVGTTWPSGYPRPAAPTRFPERGPARWVADRLVDAELRPVLRICPPGGRIADIGAGGGHRASRLVTAGLTVTAVEPDSEEAASARRRLAGRAAVVEAGLEEWKPDQTFDTALLSHVLEHLDDPVAGLTTVAKGLCPGGHVIVMVPNAFSREARVFRGRWHGWEPGRHRKHFSDAGLRRVMEAAGFVDTKVTATGGWRFAASLAYSVAPQLDPQITSGMAATVGRALAVGLAPVARVLACGGSGPQLVGVGRRP